MHLRFLTGVDSPINDCL